MHHITNSMKKVKRNKQKELNRTQHRRNKNKTKYINKNDVKKKKNVGLEPPFWAYIVERSHL